MQQEDIITHKLMPSRSLYVCHIISSFYPLIGGAERAVQSLSLGLLAAGWNVKVITTWYPGLSRQQVIGNLNVRRFGWAGPGKIRSLTFGLASLIHILCRQRAISLIHAQNIDTPLLMGMILKLLTNKKLILTIHSDQVIPQKSRTIPGRLRIALMRRWVDHFIAVSQSGRQCMLDVGISPERISLIPNGLDTDFFRPPTRQERATLRAELGYGAEDIIVLFLGRLIPSKRADLLLSALHNLSEGRNVKCIVVGDGSEKEKLQTLTQRLGLQDRVRFAGAVDNVRDFYWLSDVFVQPSQFEGLSVALLESMACGLAVIVSECKGNLELVTDRVNGLTFPVDDEQEFTKRLTELIAAPDLRAALGQQASSGIRARYSKEAVAEAHLKVYRQVLGMGADKLMGDDNLQSHSGLGRLNILRLVTYAGETCPAYQQFSRSAIARHRNTLCTYFRRDGDKGDETVTFFSGDGTLPGFVRTLKRALDAGPYDIIHVHYSFLSFFLILASVLLRRNLLRSTVYTVHTSYPNLKLRNRFFTATAFVSSKRVVFCSKASYESFPEWFLKLAGKRGVIIQNGVDIERIDSRTQEDALSDCPGDFVIVTVGRLIKVKNQQVIVQAFGRTSGAADRLIIIGEGELRSTLQTLIDTNRLGDRVHLTGLIERDKVYTYLRLADVFVSSSWVEGLPIAVLEAMACGCPVILSDIPPHREIAQDAPFIPLVAPNDVVHLAEEIARFRRLTPSERKQIGAKCRALVETRFGVTRMLDEYDRLYRQIISNAKALH